MRSIPELTIQSKKSAVLAGHTSKVQILCKLLGADTPTDLPKRSPLHLSIVLDRSGSMAGKPLEEAKDLVDLLVQCSPHSDEVSTLTEYDGDHEHISKVDTFFMSLLAVKGNLEQRIKCLALMLAAEERVFVAKQHAQAALNIHLNPIRKLMANVKTGELLLLGVGAGR